MKKSAEDSSSETALNLIKSSFSEYWSDSDSLKQSPRERNLFPINCTKWTKEILWFYSQTRPPWSPLPRPPELHPLALKYTDALRVIKMYMFYISYKYDFFLLNRPSCRFAEISYQLVIRRSRILPDRSIGGSREEPVQAWWNQHISLAAVPCFFLRSNIQKVQHRIDRTTAVRCQHAESTKEVNCFSITYYWNISWTRMHYMCYTCTCRKIQITLWQYNFSIFLDSEYIFSITLG